MNKEIEESVVREKVWAEFEKAYFDVDLRRAKLEELIAREFVGEFKPPRQVMENLVVRKWFEGVGED